MSAEYQDSVGKFIERWWKKYGAFRKLTVDLLPTWCEDEQLALEIEAENDHSRKQRLGKQLADLNDRTFECAVGSDGQTQTVKVVRREKSTSGGRRVFQLIPQPSLAQIREADKGEDQAQRFALGERIPDPINRDPSNDGRIPLHHRGIQEVARFWGVPITISEDAARVPRGTKITHTTTGKTILLEHIDHAADRKRLNEWLASLAKFAPLSSVHRPISADEVSEALRKMGYTGEPVISAGTKSVLQAKTIATELGLQYRHDPTVEPGTWYVEWSGKAYGSRE